jgi:hypothetical protein
MEHQRYPMIMNHPSNRPARKIADAAPAHPPETYFATPEQWEAEKWPQVTVTTPDDEAYYEAKGYKPAGNPDAAAFSMAQSSPYVAGRKTNEYPKMLNGVLVQDPNAPASNFQEFPKWIIPPQGDAILVKCAAEEEAYLAQWTDPNAPQALREAVAGDFELPKEEPKDEPRTLKLKKAEARVE